MIFPSDIIAAVAAEYRLKAADILARDMRPEIVRPRHVAMWVMHSLGSTYSEIGRRFGKHHTSVLHAVAVMEARVGDDELHEVRRAVEARLHKIMAVRRASQR